MGSVFTLTLAAPAVALADMSTDPNAAPDKAGMDECIQKSGEPEAPGTTRKDERQAAEQDYAQSRYQLGSNQQPEWNVPNRSFSQASYQLGAGHQD
jgi:hypothetical protein